MSGNHDEKPKFIPARKVIAEWRKDPEYMREYERQKPEFDRLRRRIDARIARRQRRKAVVAWMRGVVAKLRGFWGHITRGIGGEVL